MKEAFHVELGNYINKIERLLVNYNLIRIEVDKALSEESTEFTLSWQGKGVAIRAVNALNILNETLKKETKDG